MNRKEILFGLVVAIFFAAILSLFASPWPDGLERVAQERGFKKSGEVKPSLTSPIPDYVCPGLKSKKLATSVAGGVGTLIVFGVGYGLAVLIRRREN